MVQISEYIVKKKEPEGSFFILLRELVSNNKTLHFAFSVVHYIHHVDTVW